MIDHEKEVKKIYPDACIKEFTLTYVVTGTGSDTKVLGLDMLWPDKAWGDAYNNLVQQGEIKAQWEKGDNLHYGTRPVTVIQVDTKRGRVEVIDTEQHKEGIAGFWVSDFELLKP